MHLCAARKEVCIIVPLLFLLVLAVVVVATAAIVLRLYKQQNMSDWA